ncbi:MAG: hypothetical protein HC934_03345 [Acaryochloridaceae cyanobacterium SU_2_1]|nr:hypothetical protein [Acaryochloridaceae cyanobacterium SU_2_1]NJM95740.1 hypothetical protein [Acaryochloridaceae cyanobacterium CSU_5_19]
MLGQFQQSQLRIEVKASAAILREALTQTAQFRQWLWPQTFAADLPQYLMAGAHFTSWLGPIETQHRVDRLDAAGLRFILSGSVDGFQEWSWGEGWVQSRLEGISLLPLNMGQTATLLRLQLFLAGQHGSP